MLTNNKLKIVILLKNLGMTPVEIKKAILKMDEFIISRSVLEQLVKYVPTEEEVILLLFLLMKQLKSIANK